MKTWSDTIDPATIPDGVLKAERARRNAAKRKTKSGGRNGGRPKKQPEPIVDDPEDIRMSIDSRERLVK